MNSSGPFAWGCRVLGDHFLYVYGTTAEYWAFRGGDSRRQGSTLHLGWGPSLLSVQWHANAAAQAIAERYKETGSVRVVNAGEYLRQPGHWRLP